MIEDSQDWFWEFDENANFTYVSPRIKELLGYEPEEVLGLNAFDLMDAEEAKRVRHYFDPIAEKFLPFTGLVNVNRHKQGHDVVIESSGTPVFDDHGSFRGYRGIDRDITERRDNEIKLQKRKKLFRDFFESNPIATIVTSMNGVVFMANPAFVTMAGLPLEEILGRTTVELGFCSPPGQGEERLSQLLQQGKIENFEVTFTTREKQTLTWSLSSCLIDYEEEQRILSTILDVTVKKKTEETLRKLDQVKSDFIRIAAHELNTPLSAIVGYTEILKTAGQVADDKQLSNYVSIISNNAEALSKLISDLLDVEKIELGYGLSILLERVPLDDLIRKSVAAISFHPQSHRFVLNHANAPPEAIMVDELRMIQVLSNVLSNAVKYSPDGGEIEITTETAKDQLHISIHDSGIGMTAEQTERVFEKFYRGNPEDHTFAGLGLGMNLAKTIVDEHEGDITISSEPGKGTTVTITLPLKD